MSAVPTITRVEGLHPSKTQQRAIETILSFHQWCNENRIVIAVDVDDDTRKIFNVSEHRIVRYMNKPDAIGEDGEIEVQKYIPKPKSVVKSWIYYIHDLYSFFITTEAEPDNEQECKPEDLVKAYNKHLKAKREQEISEMDIQFALTEPMAEDTDYLVDWVGATKASVEDMIEAFGENEGSKDTRSTFEWVFKAIVDGNTMCRMVVYNFEDFDGLQIGCDRVNTKTRFLITSFKKFLTNL